MHLEKDFVNYKLTGNNILLFGSEGHGIVKHIKLYDYLVKISINKKVESLKCF